MKRSLVLAAFLSFASAAFGFLPTTTITLVNSSSYALGTVTLSANTSSSSISVSSAGTYTAQLATNLTSVTINGQTVAAPTAGVVSLPNGASVQVTWPSTNAVEVVNETTHYAPSR